MARRNIPGVREVPAKEVRELMKLSWVRDEHSDRTFDMRRLPDGRVLWYLGDQTSGTLYDSGELFAELQRKYAEEPKPLDARTLPPPIDDFIRDVEAHARSLGPRLRIPADVLDGTPESLDAVDKALKRIPWARRQVPDLVTPLVAYLGEVIRKGTGGRWTKAPTTRTRRFPVYDPDDLAHAQ